MCICIQCGISFPPKHLSSRALRGEVKGNQFCSRKCVADNRRIYPSRVEQKRAYNRRLSAKKRLLPKAAPVIRLTLCIVCSKEFAGGRGRKICSDACVKLRAQDCFNRQRGIDRSPRICPGCGTGFTPHYGSRKRIYCSTQCSRRTCRSHSKAIRRNAMAERFDPVIVFERDDWRCYLCGDPTPCELRGSYDPKAPELDHKIPIARGGQHTLENTGCACRACNIAKGAKDLVEFLAMTPYSSVATLGKMLHN